MIILVPYEEAFPYVNSGGDQNCFVWVKAEIWRLAYIGLPVAVDNCRYNFDFTFITVQRQKALS